MKTRAATLAVASITAWVVQDILVWQRLFEARGLFQYNQTYEFWHYAFLIFLLVLGVSLLRGWLIWWYAAATWTLAVSGLADVMYYWLDGRSIPENLPWLDSVHPLVIFHPATSAGIVWSAALWLCLWVGALVAKPAFACGHHGIEKLINRGRARSLERENPNLQPSDPELAAVAI